jgi:hypothetical protein
MTFRKAHGKAAQVGCLVVSECTPADQLDYALPVEPALPQRVNGGRFGPGNRIAKKPKVRAGHHGALRKLEEEAKPEWRASREFAKRAAKFRIKEYTEFHGAELSSGICSMLVGAATYRADATYLRTRAAANDCLDDLRMAIVCDASARQLERDAWELAVREAAARKQNRDRSQGSPLLGALSE